MATETHRTPARGDRRAANVAGYSRLGVGEDEEGTLAALRVLRRELMECPAVAAHQGCIVQDDRRRAAGRIRQRAGARCASPPRCTGGTTGAKCRYGGGAAHGVPVRRSPPGRHRRRGRRHFRRRGQCRGAARRLGRAGRDLRSRRGCRRRRSRTARAIRLSRISASSSVKNIARPVRVYRVYALHLAWRGGARHPSRAPRERGDRCAERAVGEGGHRRLPYPTSRR